MPNILWSQELADTTFDKIYNNNYSVGIHFNTAGWGIYGEYAKQINYKYDQAYGLCITNIHHKNEFKINGATGTRIYYYKKINSFIVIRPSYGGNLVLFNSKREDGIEVKFKWKVGPAFGFEKPVYLQILNQQGFDLDATPKKYNPEIHGNSIVEGKANWFNGFNEGRFRLGVSSKLGLNFNFAKDKSMISGGEVGVMADFFPFKEIELMYGVKNFRAFGAFYLQFEFGSKF